MALLVNSTSSYRSSYVTRPITRTRNWTILKPPLKSVALHARNVQQPKMVASHGLTVFYWKQHNINFVSANLD